MTTTRTTATTKQGAKAAKISRQATLDSTSLTMSGFCNSLSPECYSYKLQKNPTLYHSITRLAVLVLVLMCIYYFK